MWSFSSAELYLPLNQVITASRSWLGFTSASCFNIQNLLFNRILSIKWPSISTKAQADLSYYGSCLWYIFKSDTNGMVTMIRDIPGIMFFTRIYTRLYVKFLLKHPSIGNIKCSWVQFIVHSYLICCTYPFSLELFLVWICGDYSVISMVFLYDLFLLQ